MKIKEIIRYLTITVLLLPSLMPSSFVYASDTSNATYAGHIIIANNGAAATCVSVNCVIDTQGLIDAGFIHSNCNNTAIKDANGDVVYMPAPGTTDDWMIFVSSIGANTTQTDSLYTGGSNDMDASIRYFPGLLGMNVTDASNMEIGTLEFEIEIDGWFDPDAVGYLLDKSAISIYCPGDGSINATAYSGVGQKTVTATGITAGEHLIELINDSEFLTLYVDSVEEDDVALTVQQIPPNKVCNTTSASIQHQAVQRGFYAKGLLWLFHVGTTDFDIFTSTDGETWTDEGNESLTFYPRTFATDGDKLHVLGFSATNVYYRMAALNDNGTITWDADGRQTIGTLSSGVPSGMNIIIDSLGYPVVSYSAAADTDTFTKRSTTNNGVWTADASYDKSWNFYSFTQIAAMDDGRVGIIFGATGSGVLSNFYEPGTGWDQATYEVATTPLLASAESFSVTAIDNDMHLIFNESVNNDLNHAIYDYAGSAWGSNTTIKANADYALAPIATYNNITDTLTCFWLDTNDDKIYYMDYDVDGDTWDGSETEFADETTDDLQDPSYATAFQHYDTNRLLLQYQTKTSSPYYLKVSGYVPSGVNMTDNANDWQWVTNNTMPYVEYVKMWVSEIQRLYIEWENDASNFSDLSGNSNDATPTFRTTSSDSDVSAYLATFMPIGEWEASYDYTEDISSIVETPGTIPEMYQELQTVHLPGAGFANDMLSAAGIPLAMFWFPLAIGSIIVVGFFIYAKSRSLLTQGTVCLFVAAFWSLTGVLPFWIIIIFAIEIFVVFIAQKQFGW